MSTEKKVIRSVSLSQAASQAADKMRGQLPFSVLIENLILGGGAPTLARQTTKTKKHVRQNAAQG